MIHAAVIHAPALLAVSTLVHLSPVDLVIIVFYFALVLAIGLYLKGRSNTGEDFFMAGREMTAVGSGLGVLVGEPRIPGTDGLGRQRL